MLFRSGELEASVRQLQAEQEEAEKLLETARKEINTQKLEAVKVEAKTAIIAKVGSLLGSGKIKELEADNRSLQNEIAAREESIGDLQASLQRQRAQHGRELATVQTDYIQKLERERERTAYLQKWTERACGWFPLFADAMRMERYCHSAGFTPEQTDRLFTFQPLEYSGNLYSERSEEHTSELQSH